MSQLPARSTGKPHPSRWWHPMLIGFLALLMTGSNLAGSWRFDDPLILQYVQALPDFHTPFVDALAWRELGAPFFTPLLTLVFQLAHQLFGLNSMGHYAVHLLALVAVGLLTHAVVAPRASPLGGLFAAALFLLGAPTGVVAAQLMATHYLWGLVLALLSLITWQRFLLTRAWGWAAASAALYLLAMLGKEIFAPLPLVFLVLAWTRGWAALMGLAGHSVAAIGYVLWRSAMIGSTVGGYGGHEAGLRMLESALPTLAQSVWGPGWPAWVAAACALLLVARALWFHGAMAVALLLCVLMAVLLPFGFVGATTETVHLRLSFLPWWALCVGVGFGMARPLSAPAPPSHSPSRRAWVKARGNWVWAPLALMSFIVLNEQQRTQAELVLETDVYDAYARHALAPPRAGWALLQGAASADLHFQYGLGQLARRQSLAPTTVEAFDQQAIHATGQSVGYVYDPACRCMALRQAMEVNAPSDSSQRIQMQFVALATRGLQWHLSGPEPGGAWYLQIPGLGITMLFPASGAIHFATPPWLLRQAFRVVWRRADGSWVQTSLQTFPRPGQTLRY